MVIDCVEETGREEGSGMACECVLCSKFPRLPANPPVMISHFSKWRQEFDRHQPFIQTPSSSSKISHLCQGLNCQKVLPITVLKVNLLLLPIGPSSALRQGENERVRVSRGRKPAFNRHLLCSGHGKSHFIYAFSYSCNAI